MKVIYEHCAGLDRHKTTLVACAIIDYPSVSILARLGSRALCGGFLDTISPRAIVRSRVKLGYASGGRAWVVSRK
jgi:hypothetical protein